jgi:hypothetical protein
MGHPCEEMAHPFFGPLQGSQLAFGTDPTDPYLAVLCLTNQGGNQTPTFLR